MTTGHVCVIECDSSILFLFILFLFMQDLPMVHYERFQEEEKQAHLVVSYKFLTYAPHDWLTWTCALAVVDLGKQVDYLIWSHDNMGEGFFFVQALILFADGRLD